MTERVGGRPRQIETADITRAGRELGMRELSLKAVATRLGVSSTALYRHVDGRWGLERLVGESLLSELHLRENPCDDAVRHLVSFGLQLRAHVLAHPGLVSYVQTLFPRGASGRRLLTEQVDALQRRGYDTDAAIVLCSATASIALGHAAAEDLQHERGDGIEAARDDVRGALRADESLGEAHRKLPDVDATQYVRLMLTAAVRGLVAAAPPGRGVDEIIAELESTVEGI